MFRPTFILRRHCAAIVCSAVLALATACGGGGGGDAGTTSGGETTATGYSQGAISGFGSVIVNGVRWDDSGASVSDDDGVRHPSSDLRLGMVIEVDGSRVDRSTATATGRALAIRYGSEMLGPIGSIDSSASTLTVLGQTVAVTASTVFDASISGGLAGLSSGAVIEIHGLYDAAASRTVATRIEVKTNATEYRLRGTVAGLDSVARTFSIGSELISYASAAEVAATLADGLQVKVRMATTQTAGAWVANKVRLIKRQVADRSEAEIEGVITVWTSATDFEVNGLQVDASSAAFPEGQAAIVLGARVEVEGALANGVLVATKVHLEDDEHEAGPSREFELHGLVGNLDSAAKTFSLRGLTVSYAGSVTFKGDAEARLANGVKVEVKGTLSVDLTTIVATRIGLDS